MRMSGWSWLALAGAVGVGLTGCGGAGKPPAVQNRVALTSFSGPMGCADLEQYIEDTAVQEMKTRLEAQRDNSSGGGFWLGVERTADAAPMAAGGAESQNAGPSAYTTTNTQVAGVDEADFVKNDGTRIFVLSGDTLYLNKSWPANELGNVSKLKIEGWPREMFLDDKNRLVVFSAIYTSYPLDQRWSDAAPCSRMYCGYAFANTVKLTVVDVSDLANPKVTRQFYLPGHYSSSRRIGSSVRLVLSDDFRFPPDLRWYPDYDEALYSDKALLAKAYDRLIVENEKSIRARTLPEWLPTSKTVADGVTTEVGYDCSHFFRSNASTKLGLLTVATLNLDNPNVINRTSVVAETGEVYASHSSLYVANRHWWWWPEPGQTDATYLHKFDITHPDNAVYVASGQVSGHIVDQFSMDENAAGYFRIATTIATRVVDPLSRWGRMETTNRVQVLAEDSGVLKVAGQTEELAKGERIFSARFVEDRAYVVTFRQVDPLFTFDLSDPSSPKKIGELKIPGFSSYIHPLDKDHLLTIGTYVPEDQTWGGRAVQLAIFDVSDMANPVQKFVQLVGTAYASSEAQYDHKAFNYFPERKLLAIPFFDWSSGASGADYWYSFTSDLRVFGVDTQGGFTPKGALSMKDLYQVHNRYSWTYYWQPRVRRSVMADQYVYAISDAGIRVADVASLTSPLATVQFSPTVEQ